MDINNVDLIIECSAEASVMAGVTSSPRYLLDTNVTGAINCFELARKRKADVIFLSTSRVYPVRTLNELHIIEKKSRFALAAEQILPGASAKGISENFLLDGARSLYGSTKLAAELLLQEYAENYGIRVVINRCGLISGPWQMGKADQGIIAYWVAAHVYDKPLFYIGFGGSGKQVRDVLHIDDLYRILSIQIKHMSLYNGQVYNIGGGNKNSVSLLELTEICEDLSKKKITTTPVSDTRAGDIKLYITDNSKIHKISKWAPEKTVEQTTEDVFRWMMKNKNKLRKVFDG